MVTFMVGLNMPHALQYAREALMTTGPLRRRQVIDLAAYTRATH